MRPAANRSRTRGSSRSRSATRRCSRAVDGAIPTAQDSHAAGVRAPWSAQSPRTTNSATYWSHWQVAAAMAAAPSRTCRSSAAASSAASEGSGPSLLAYSMRTSCWPVSTDTASAMTRWISAFPSSACSPCGPATSSCPVRCRILRSLLDAPFVVRSSCDTERRARGAAFGVSKSTRQSSHCSPAMSWNAPPWASATAAMRPTPGMSNGSAWVSPPSALIFSQSASTSSEPM